MSFDTITSIVVNSQGLVILFMKDSSTGNWGRGAYNQTEALELIQMRSLGPNVEVTADTNQDRLHAKAEAKAERFAARAGLPYTRPAGW